MSVVRLATTNVVPKPIRGKARRFQRQVQHVGRTHYCPICRSHIRAFRPAGSSARRGRCPVCGSLERHRLRWLYLTRETDLFDPPRKRLLHVAPEKYLMDLLAAHKNIDYLSADLSSPLAMIEMDITDIQMPDNQFDVVLCSHVLEHVAEDRKAMSELLRVLKPGGWALIQVPLGEGPTYENWDIVTPEDRVEHFGQDDHVRMYGRDILQRLRDAGFDADEIPYGERFTADQMQYLGLPSNWYIYHCRKPGTT